ncbi:MAG TPA: hypothetical protein VKW78_13415 [Terriglobales bacterium]|nr:hypothetical protein [Terriglobales bacterium]
MKALFSILLSTAMTFHTATLLVAENPTLILQSARVASADSTRTAHGVRFADQFPPPSITNAIADAGKEPVIVFVPCGTYYDNISITRSNVSIIGGGRDCTNVAPRSDKLPVIAIDATSSGVTGINHVNISDLSLHNPQRYNVDGLVIKGRLDIDQPNDRHSIRRVYISGFRNGVSILGRMIWSEFDFVFSEANTANGWYISSPAVQHDNLFVHIRSAYNGQYGVYWNNSNRRLLSAANSWINPNIEYNGIKYSIDNCAGFYATGTTSGSITDGYFEGNCTASTDGRGADIRLTGSYAREFNITNSYFSSQINIYNDAKLTTGEYRGNFFFGRTSLRIATDHPDSRLVIGQNRDTAEHSFMLDRSGNSHVEFLNSLVFSASGKQLQKSHITTGRAKLLSSGKLTVNLAAGSAFESSQSYVCTVQDVSSPRVITYSPESGSKFTVTGAANDRFTYLCAGS